DGPINHFEGNICKLQAVFANFTGRNIRYIVNEGTGRPAGALKKGTPITTFPFLCRSPRAHCRGEIIFYFK
ncbi:MAG: hypothetical protein IJI26_01285, partial [Clostridia bacterium]|nr:hypothetical protein [Clostridia bacterium]